MKKLSKAKKAVLMLTMLLSLTAAFANDGSTDPIGNFLGKFWGTECTGPADSPVATQCCTYRFWIQVGDCTPV